MELDEVNYDEHIQVTSAECFMSIDSSGGGTTEDAPAPRIGDDYQAVLPSLQQFDCLEAVRASKGGDGTTNGEQQLGLDVPIGWISCQEFDVSQNCTCSRPSNYRANDLGNLCGSCQAIGHIAEGTDEVPYHDKHQEHTAASYWLNVDNINTEKSADFVPLPLGSSETWNDDEMESFILGLYIFGKNLALLQKFVESKKMSDILSLYYGKFYMCEAHRKWSECKKSKGRKRILGHHLLGGWRKQELLSRLLPSIREESQKYLSEATRIFNEQGMSLEKYVFTLKDIVGVKALVKAVAIGKGKYDLTSTVVDPARGNQVRSIHSEIPIGKACSSLTDAEVVKFLTGDYRLSKARSNDLFWEAVWPRLLARGWHSEQPKDQVAAASKHSLIFLTPGIKKFSRRKLTKGVHYFDSVSDVLNKVASDPRILEMGTEHVNNSVLRSAAGNSRGLESGADLECNDVADKQSCDFLHQKTSSCSSHLMKFTVVDTSLVRGEAPFQVRELRCLPMDNPISCFTTSDETDCSSSKEHDSSDESLHGEEKHSPDTSKDQKLENKEGCNFGRGTQPDRPAYFSNISKKNEEKHNLVRFTGQKMENQFEKVTMTSERSVEYTVTVPKGKRAGFVTGTTVQNTGGRNKGAIKHQFTRRRKAQNSNFTSPVSEQSMITMHINSENGASPSLVRDGHLAKEGGSTSKTFDAVVNLEAELCQPHCDAPFSSSVKNGPKKNNENCSTMMEPMEEKSQHRGLIDLNLPQYPPEFDADGQYLLEVPVNQSYSNVNATSLPEVGPLPADFSACETCNRFHTGQHSAMESRRQSSRSRPLTTRALEALESGFLNIKRRARGYRFAHPDASRASRHTHRTSGNCGKDGFEMMDTKDAKRDEECTSYANEVAFSSKSHIEMANA